MRHSVEIDPHVARASVTLSRGASFLLLPKEDWMQVAAIVLDAAEIDRRFRRQLNEF